MDERVDKSAARRAELAGATLKTLSELGYARTSLREIAQNSDFSHGVLHYYFRDKVDLITHCVREYKAVCVTRYDQVVATATTPAQLQAGFLDKLAQTLVEEPHMHRLWYDLRNQSMFEESFRADVAAIDASLERMVWRVVSRFAELLDTPPRVSSATMYALFDGLFQQALLRQLAGDPDAAADLQAAVTSVVAQVVPLEREPVAG
ncbi:TetR/AcrR family transcriptional regulator [Modestobacter sp. Leaf380]|uniref:TetR/AcrR family transcriptional regulator n=1 Tax=Modestobacter sp. Leaf380 TaxID=1736356 RepID=UPI000B1E0575|nr:TetR/AcrR family transcriptional regulator [Modestobacter sp. Leaf380]